MSAGWTYSDWIEQTTRVGQVTRLRAHIREVSDRIDVGLSVGGDSQSSDTLQRYLEGLREELRSLDPTGNLLASGASRPSPFVRGRARRSDA